MVGEKRFPVHADLGPGLGWGVHSSTWVNAMVAGTRRASSFYRKMISWSGPCFAFQPPTLKAILSHARDRSSLMEVRANAFAASFLMPAEGVRGYVNALSKGLGRTRADTFDEEAVTRVEGRKRVDTQNIELHDVVRMAHHFGVSCTAMLYRLKGLTS